MQRRLTLRRETDAVILPYQKNVTKQLAEKIETAFGGATELSLMIYEQLYRDDVIRIPNQDLEWYHFMEQGNYRELYDNGTSAPPGPDHWYLPFAEEIPPGRGMNQRDTCIRYDLEAIRNRGVFKPALWGEGEPCGESGYSGRSKCSVWDH
jgi:hypothetical protein